VPAVRRMIPLFIDLSGDRDGGVEARCTHPDCVQERRLNRIAYYSVGDVLIGWPNAPTAEDLFDRILRHLGQYHREEPT
jgi:hypothetical protein